MQIVDIGGEERIVAEEVIPLNCCNCISTSGCDQRSDDPLAFMAECAIRRCTKDRAGIYGTFPLPVKCDSMPDGISVRDFCKEINAAVNAVAWMRKCPLYYDSCEVECDGECIPYDGRCKMNDRGMVYIPIDDLLSLRIEFVPEGPFITFAPAIFAAA